jgi:hypothetical protein
LCTSQRTKRAKRSLTLANAPPELSQYCAEFAAPDTKIIEGGPLVMECKGVGGRKHNFLAAAGYGNCAKCKHNICMHCQTKIGMDQSTYCLLCGATESLVPDRSTEAATPIESLRRILIDKHSFPVA